MSADWTVVNGRFKSSGAKLNEVLWLFEEKLAEYFEEDCIFLSLESGYLKLEYEESWGRCGSFVKYLRDEFIKTFPEVQFELYYVFFDPDGKGGEKVIYDGKRYEEEQIGVSYEGGDFVLGLECPECGGRLKLREDYCYCGDCDSEFYDDDLDLDEPLSELYEEKVSAQDEEFDKQVVYMLIK